MPFNGFGYLKLQVRRADSTLLVRNHYLTGFGLSPDGAGRFDSIRPALRADVVVSRALYAPADTDYLRYFDIVLPRLRPRGLLLAHNVVNKEREMRDFLHAIRDNPSLLTAIVKPSGEGMSVSVKIR